MEQVSQEQIEKVMAMKPEKKEIKEAKLTEDEFQDLLAKMQNPVDAQKELAIQIKIFLDNRIKEELNSEKGVLSEHTRKWVESYNNILEKIQKSLYGDKSVNLHVHKVSHSLIAAKMREVRED